MTETQIKMIDDYGLSFETEINGITYYTNENKDGYYFVDDTDQCGIFESKEKFYKWANMRERLTVPAIKL